jgi:hypothetical protein
MAGFGGASKRPYAKEFIQFSALRQKDTVAKPGNVE